MVMYQIVCIDIYSLLPDEGQLYAPPAGAALISGFHQDSDHLLVLSTASNIKLNATVPTCITHAVFSLPTELTMLNAPKANTAHPKLYLALEAALGLISHLRSAVAAQCSRKFSINYLRGG